MALLIKRLPALPKNFGSPSVAVKKNVLLKRKVASPKSMLEQMPAEILCHLVAFLDAPSVAHLAQTNRFLANFFQSDFVWRILYQTRWGDLVPPPVVVPAPKSPKGSASPNKPQSGWRDNFKLRLQRTCSLCSQFSDGGEKKLEFSCWKGMRFCKACQKEKFVTKRIALASYPIAVNKFEQLGLPHFEALVGRQQEKRFVRLFYKPDIESILAEQEAEKERKKAELYIHRRELQKLNKQRAQQPTGHHGAKDKSTLPPLTASTSPSTSASEDSAKTSSSRPKKKQRTA